MKNKLFLYIPLYSSIFLLFFLGTNTSHAQTPIWSVGLHSFFDNYEFGEHSNVNPSNTMSGIHFTPQIGISYNEFHRVMLGADLLHELGSNQIIDNSKPIIYYEFNDSLFHFKMGNFPRESVISYYPRFFFSDSIKNYRPIISGLFWGVSSDNNFINVWLDWTSKQTYIRKETFIMGWSGRYNLSPLFFQHLGYMYHYAGSMNHAESVGLRDIGMFLSSLGVDFRNSSSFSLLECNVGWALGLERNRALTDWIPQHGFYSEIKIEYMRLGFTNMLYLGEGVQYFYHENLNELYWGDRIFRSRRYNRSDIYIQFLKNSVVDIKFTYSLHCTEKEWNHQQSLYVCFNLKSY